MCKVLMIAGIKKQHQEKVQEITAKFAEVYSRVDNDGFGYAAINSNGKIFGEKWLRKEDAFKLHHQPEPDMTYKQAVDFFSTAAGKIEDSGTTEEKIYDSFGEATEDAVAVIFHARKKTQGEKNIQNTHPFVLVNDKHDPDTAIIHNGSIVNHMTLTKKFSTCDSEVILHEYLDQCMYYNPYMIDKMSKTLVGEYAVGVLSSILYEDQTVTPVLDIFKSNKDLYGCYVKEIETFLWSTSDWSIKEVLKDLKLNYVALTEIKDGFLIRLNAITGERMDNPIPFELSRRTPDFHQRQIGPAANQSDNVHSINRQKKETVDEAKGKFEKKHGDIFSDPYYDPTDGLTPVERAYFDELEKDKNTDVRALRLVKRIMNL